MAAGSAGTICGLAIAKYLSGAKIKSVATIRLMFNVATFVWFGGWCPLCPVITCFFVHKLVVDGLPVLASHTTPLPLPCKFVDQPHACLSVIIYTQAPCCGNTQH